MINLAQVEQLEISRLMSGLSPFERQLVQSLFLLYFPQARETSELSPEQRRAWINQLRLYTRGLHKQPVIDPQIQLPFQETTL